MLSADPSEVPILQSTVSVTPETVAEIATAISCALRPDPGLAENVILGPATVAVPTKDIVPLVAADPPYLVSHAAFNAAVHASPALLAVVEAVAEPNDVADTLKEPTVKVT